MPIERLKPTPRYSQVVVYNSTAYLAGVIAVNYDADIEQQSREVFGQIDELLAVAGSCKEKLLSMTCWIKDFADYAAFNAVYESWIDKSNLPARATVRADMLDPRLRIEVMATAAI